MKAFLNTLLLFILMFVCNNTSAQFHDYLDNSYNAMTTVFNREGLEIHEGKAKNDSPFIIVDLETIVASFFFDENNECELVTAFPKSEVEWDQLVAYYHEEYTFKGDKKWTTRNSKGYSVTYEIKKETRGDTTFEQIYVYYTNL